MSDTLFPADDFEIPLLPEPRARKGSAVGSWVDARFQNDYPPDWNRCSACEGTGIGSTVEWATGVEAGVEVVTPDTVPITAHVTKCAGCLGMGSWKAMVRLLAGHRCIRCLHPYMPKGDAKMLGVEASGVGGEHMGGRWSACDKSCTHGAPVRFQITPNGHWFDANELPLTYGLSRTAETAGQLLEQAGYPGLADVVEAEWRILTVHHLDGDKANCRWWNLAALCQRCHLEVQAKVVMERVYPWPHSDWFKPHVAGYYAFVYLCRVCGRTRDEHWSAWDGEPHTFEAGVELTREQAMERLDELLALELA